MERDTEPRRDLLERSEDETNPNRDNRRRKSVDVFADDPENPQICRSID